MVETADKKFIEYGVIDFDKNTGKGTFEINIPEYERKLATGLYAPIQLLYNHLLCIEECMRYALNQKGPGILERVTPHAHGVLTLNMCDDSIDAARR